MANTYSQLLEHIVFAVSHRENFIPEFFRIQLQQYISGIARKMDAVALAVYCNPDHTHILIGHRPNFNVAHFVQEVKKATNAFVNNNLLLMRKFRWQSGYGVFSCSIENKEKVINYIRNQKEHHEKTTFKAEYHEILDRANIPYEEDFLFDFFDSATPEG